MLPTHRTWRPPGLLPGSHAAPGGARAPAAAPGAAPARAGGGCSPLRSRDTLLTRTSQRDSGTTIHRGATCARTPTGRPRRVYRVAARGSPVAARTGTPPTLPAARPPRTAQKSLVPRNPSWGPGHLRIAIRDFFRILPLPAPNRVTSLRTARPPTPGPLGPRPPGPEWRGRSGPEWRGRSGGGARALQAPIGAGARPAGPERAQAAGWLRYKSRALAPAVRLLSGGAA